jgi:hypothetical protein
VGGLTAGGTRGSETKCEGQQGGQTRLWRLEVSENSRVDSMGTEAKIYDIFLVLQGGDEVGGLHRGGRKEGLEADWRGKIKAREAGVSGGMAPGMGTWLQAWGHGSRHGFMAPGMGTWSRPIAAGGLAEPTKSTGNIFPSICRANS